MLAPDLLLQVPAPTAGEQQQWRCTGEQPATTQTIKQQKLNLTGRGHVSSCRKLPTSAAAAAAPMELPAAVICDPAAANVSIALSSAATRDQRRAGRGASIVPEAAVKQPFAQRGAVVANSNAASASLDSQQRDQRLAGRTADAAAAAVPASTDSIHFKIKRKRDHSSAFVQCDGAAPKSTAASQPIAAAAAPAAKPCATLSLASQQREQRRVSRSSTPVPAATAVVQAPAAVLPVAAVPVVQPAAARPTAAAAAASNGKGKRRAKAATVGSISVQHDSSEIAAAAAAAALVPRRAPSRSANSSSSMKNSSSVNNSRSRSSSSSGSRGDNGSSSSSSANSSSSNTSSSSNRRTYTRAEWLRSLPERRVAAAQAWVRYCSALPQQTHTALRAAVAELKATQIKRKAKRQHLGKQEKNVSATAKTLHLLKHYVASLCAAA
jgi:hypothetical protein